MVWYCHFPGSSPLRVLPTRTPVEVIRDLRNLIMMEDWGESDVMAFATRNFKNPLRSTARNPRRKLHTTISDNMATGKAKLGALAGAVALSFALLPLACALALLAVAVALLRSRVRMRARAPEVGPLAGVAPIGVMRARHSWRSYSDRVPSDDQLDALRRFAADPAVRTGPIAGSRVDVVFVRSDALSGRQQLGTYGFVSGAKCFAVGVLREGQAPEDFGAVFERVVLEAVRMGL
eukprot:m51a1_g6504 hypothetical protein (235) ;mRNA; f:220706-224225